MTLEEALQYIARRRAGLGSAEAVLLEILGREVTAPPPTDPQSPVCRAATHPKPPRKSAPTTKANGVSAGILAFLRGKPSQPRAAIFAAVKGATPYHLKQLVTSNVVLATGNTFSRRYAVPASNTKPAVPTVTVPDMEIVFNGAKGQSLSGYASKLRG